MRRVDSLEKTLMLGGIGGRRKRGRQDEMAGWYHWLDERESEWIPGVGDEQGGLACCDSWGCKESDTTEWLNWTELAFWKKSYDKHRQHIKKQRHHFDNKSLYSQSYGFSSSHVWLWVLDHKEGWRRLLRVPWTAKRSNQLILKEINPEYFGRTVNEAPVLWPPDSKICWKRPWC